MEPKVRVLLCCETQGTWYCVETFWVEAATIFTFLRIFIGTNGNKFIDHAALHYITLIEILILRALLKVYQTLDYFFDAPGILD